MTPEQWRQIEILFEAALTRPTSERAAFLEDACGEDAPLRAEVESLLASHEQDDDFLSIPMLAQPEMRVAESSAAAKSERRIGPYRLLHPIGHGGMGTVYLAVRADDTYRKQVALKILIAGMDSQAIERRFRNERQILASLDHPNIAKLLDGGTTEEGHPYFVMDYIEGTPIDQYCATHRLSIDQKLKLFRTVCAAVHYAHQNLVVHRDLKPANILVTAKGVAKLLDFGIAKLLNPELSTQTLELTVALRPMTPEYASPEQVCGATITTASDVYSLGVLLYELLTGQLPYQFLTRTPQEFERVICQLEPKKPSMAVRPVKGVHLSVESLPTPADVIRLPEDPPAKLGRRLRGDLDNILLKALRKEPSRRYGSVEQFSEDLRRYLEGLPITARRDTFGYRSAKFIKRHKAGVLAAVLLAASLLIGIISTRRQAERAEQQAAYNRQLLYAAEINLANQALNDFNFGRTLELLEAQEPITGQQDLRGFEWYYLRRRCLSKLSTLQSRAAVYSVAVSPDGKILATAHDDHSAKLWDLATERELKTFRGHTARIWSVAFSPDGRVLVTGSGDGMAKLWDVATGRELNTLRTHTATVWSVAFSPDGRRLATGSDDGTVKLWDGAAGQELHTLKGHTGQVFSVAFDRDGKRVATGSSDRTAKLWDAATGQPLSTLRGHSAQVFSVAFSPDSLQLATGSYDGTAKLWDVATGHELITLPAPSTYGVLSVAFAPDGRRLATGNGDSTARLWDVTTGQELMTLKGHVSQVYSVVFFPDGRRLATGSLDQTAKLWDITAGQEQSTFHRHRDLIRAAVFAPDGRYFATGSEDRTAKVWDAATGQVVTNLKGHDSGVTSVVFSRDGQRLITGSRDRTAKLWDTNGRELITFRGHTDIVWSVAMSPDGGQLATGSWDRTIKLWQAGTGRELISLKGHTGPVYAIAFFRDGRCLATGSFDNSAKLWDLATGRELATLGHTSWITSLAIAPDGQRLATGSADSTVKLWDVTTRRTLITLKGHRGMVQCVAFSPDGKRLISGSRDRTAKLWDTATGRELITFKGRSGVNSAGFSPNGQIIVTGNADGTLTIWDITPREVPIRTILSTLTTLVK